MRNYQYLKLGSLFGTVVAAMAFSSLLLFAVAVQPLSAKKVDSLDKHVTSPVRLAWALNGDLLVSDYQSQSILIVDPTTRGLIRKIKINGRPGGVSGDDKLIYVGNESSGSVEVYSRNGKLTAAWGNGGIGLPNDIAIDHGTGQVFVVDTQAKHVRVFNAQGQDIGTIPDAGVAQILSYPTAVVIDPETMRVYVSDQGPSVDSIGFSNRNARVRVYSYDGAYIDTLTGAFTRPQGLTLSPDGYLYLADGMRSQVLVFDLLSKTLVKTIGSPGTDPGQLYLPLDVAINAGTGDLWVANNRAGRLELFPGGGVAP